MPKPNVVSSASPAHSPRQHPCPNKPRLIIALCAAAAVFRPFGCDSDGHAPGSDTGAIDSSPASGDAGSELSAPTGDASSVDSGADGGESPLLIKVASDSSGVKRFSIGDNAFVPIGVNYLIEGQGMYNGSPYDTFDMFDTQTFNLQIIDDSMQSIASSGFNYVRLFLKGIDTDNGFASPTSNGAYDPSAWAKYVSNIAATVHDAEKYGLHVILTGSFPGPSGDLYMPANYLPSSSNLPPTTSVDGMNRLLLIPALAQALGQFYHDLLTALLAIDPNIGRDIFYFDTYTEAHYDLNEVPLSQTTGTFTYDSISYDLSDFNSDDSTHPTGRQALMDRATQNFIQTLTARVKEVLPDVLVAASSFFNAGFKHFSFDGGAILDEAPNSYALRPYYVLQGGVDLIDIHTYPSPGFDMRAATDLAGNEILPVGATTATATTIDATMSPLLAGEFGAYPAVYGVTKSSTQAQYTAALEAAVSEMQATETSALCTFDFSGYGVWSWNGVSDTFVLVSPNADPGYLYMNLLAPKYSPTFCGQSVSP